MSLEPFTVRRPSVLVIEDEALIAMETMGHLTEWGYRVSGAAGTGREAVAIACSWGADVALVDVGLRDGEDGVELARLLKSRFGAKIVFVTGFNDDYSVSRMQAVGPVALVAKPYEPSVLQGILAASRSEGAPGTAPGTAPGIYTEGAAEAAGAAMMAAPPTSDATGAPMGRRLS